MSFITVPYYIGSFKRRERKLREAERADAILRTAQQAPAEYAKALSYVAQRFSLQKYRYRNYTADEQVYKGYIQSSLGAACISRYEIAYPEPDKEVFENDKPYKNPGLLNLLQRPNQWMTETDFDRYTIKYQLCTGNCYWIKLDKNGDPCEGRAMVSLFPFNDMNITPVGTAENFIEYYKFITFDGDYTRIEPEDVIHMPWPYINPLYPNKGISPGALAALDIDTDTSFGRFIAAFIANDATPNGALKVMKDAIAGSAGVSEATAKKLKSTFRERFSSANKGEPAILEPGFEWQAIGSPIKDLDLQHARATPEARTCALYLIPPEVVGVNVGMQHGTENNLAAAEIRWTNRSLVPLWVQNAKKLSAGLQREYPGIQIKYNIASVASVREQRQNFLALQAPTFIQLLLGYSSGAIAPDIARASAIFLYGMPEEESLAMFPKIPPRSTTEVTDTGDLVASEPDKKPKKKK